MVTLTLKKYDGLSGPELRDAIGRLGIVQVKMHDILRADDYCRSRIEHHSTRGNEGKVLEWSNRLDSLPAMPPASGGKTTYIWSREITTGGDGRGWHAHVHYLAPTEADARRMVAAWLEATRRAEAERVACEEIRRASPWYRPASRRPYRADVRAQHISRPKRARNEDDPDGCAPIRDAARYITHYVAKTDIGEWSEETIRAYIYGTHGMRTYDAGGRWRPLGIGKKRDPSSSPVVRIAYPIYSVDVAGNLSVTEKTESFQGFMRQNGKMWETFRAVEKSTLNQYKTSLANSSLEALFGYSVLKNSIQNPTNFIPTEKLLEYRRFVGEFEREISSAETQIEILT